MPHLLTYLLLALLAESFEQSHGNPAWLPTDWHLQQSDPLLAPSQTWHITSGDPLLTMHPDGTYCMGIEGNQPYRNERLLTAPLELTYPTTLTFRLYYDPAYLFCIDAEHVDFDRYEFISQQKAVTLQVWIQPEGEEPTKLFDLTDQYAGYTLQELLADMPPAEMREFSVPLPAKEQSTRLIFQYTGTQGTYLYLDDIRVSLPVQQSSYRFPQGMLYWGTDCTSGWHTLSMDGKTLGLIPVYTDLTFTADPLGIDVEYAWDFTDPTCAETVRQDGYADTFTINCHPHHQTPALQRNNLYPPVTLQPHSTGKSYSPYDGCLAYLQAGGKPEYEVASKIRNYGLLNFDPLRDGIETSEDISNAGTDAVMNLMEAPLAPLVVDGIWLNARGGLSPDARFHASLCGVLEDGTFTEPLCSAECKASEVEYASSSEYGYMSIPFVFDAPVVLNAAEYDRYAIAVEGLQSESKMLLPAFSGNGGSHHSASGYIRATSGEFVPAEGKTFAINLDAYYPWLTAEINAITFGAEETEVEMDLDSYHYGTDLKVVQSDGSPLPGWLTVWGEGRYNNTRLHFRAEDPGTAQYLSLLITAPGVSLPLTMDRQSSASLITTDESTSEWYTLQGIRIPKPTHPGIYLHREGGARRIVLVH